MFGHIRARANWRALCFEGAGRQQRGLRVLVQVAWGRSDSVTHLLIKYCSDSCYKLGTLLGTRNEKTSNIKISVIVTVCSLKELSFPRRWTGRWHNSINWWILSQRPMGEGMEGGHLTLPRESGRKAFHHGKWMELSSKGCKVIWEMTLPLSTWNMAF